MDSLVKSCQTNSRHALPGVYVTLLRTIMTVQFTNLKKKKNLKFEKLILRVS